jgi:hypothetical protein
MVSKVGAQPQSGFVLVVASPGPDVGFDCFPGPCRWGDYAGASADPTPPPAPVGNKSGGGQVWLSNMYSSGGTDNTIAQWRTKNWAAFP